MYPKNISEYLPTDSERIVYQELKNQLPDTFDVFYSVSWTSYYAGRLVKSEADFIVASRDEAIESYREWIVKQPQLLRDLHELKGKTLGCWCKPKTCHGDVLVELVNDMFRTDGFMI